MDKDELYCKLVCALEHNMDACQHCMQCKGKNFAEIRMNLVRELAKYMNKEVPWDEKED